MGEARHSKTGNTQDDLRTHRIEAFSRTSAMYLGCEDVPGLRDRCQRSMGEPVVAVNPGCFEQRFSDSRPGGVL